MIYYSIPFDRGKNIGRYYNEFMQLLNFDDDWACFIDGDAMFLHPFFGRQLEDVIKQNPEYGVFTAYTNRVNCNWQMLVNVDGDDIRDHRRFAGVLFDRDYADVENVTNKPRGNVLSGVLMLVKRETWRQIGGFREDGMLGIDNQLHWDCQDHKIKVGLMKGVYVYHWYRGGNKNDKKHLV